MLTSWPAVKYNYVRAHSDLVHTQQTVSTPAHKFTESNFHDYVQLRHTSCLKNGVGVAGQLGLFLRC